MDQEHLPEKKRFLRIDVAGDNSELWQRLRPKLLQAIEDLLDSVIDTESGATVREEMKHLTTSALKFAKAHPARPGLENDKLQAEIHRLYAQSEVDRAEARNRNADAATKEFELKVKKLRVALRGAKALLAGDPGGEALVFATQIDEFLAVLDDTAAAE